MANINKHRTRKGMLFMATFTIRGKNVEITPALRDYVEKRIGKVTRYFKEVGEISALHLSCFSLSFHSYKMEADG